MPIEWTAQRLAELDSRQVRQISENAAKIGRHDIVEMCECALENRLRSGRRQMRVSEFHFVCSADTGVSVKDDGTFATGVWKVSEVHKEPSIRLKTVLALHETKAQPSYRQGTIVGWDDVPRGEFGDGVGVRFIIAPLDIPIAWFGEGSGEKGYRWVEHKDR